VEIQGTDRLTSNLLKKQALWTEFSRFCAFFMAFPSLLCPVSASSAWPNRRVQENQALALELAACDGDLPTAVLAWYGLGADLQRLIDLNQLPKRCIP
jgi:hypothetical protein